MGDAVTGLAVATVKEGKQVIVFAESKRSAEKAAEMISVTLGVQPALFDLAKNILSKSPTKQCTRLAMCIQKGAAFHHSGVTSSQREAIEGAYQSGILKVICATPTLAYGLDTPAFRVILKSLKRYSGKWGMNWIPVLEYLQMAGRAGRPQFHDEHGEAIAIAKSDIEHDEIHARYVMGEPEQIFSKLAVEPVLRTYVLSLIATGFARSRAQLIEFFSRTFWAHQYGDMEQLNNIIDKMLGLLERWGFILSQHSDFVAADTLDEGVVRATLLGQRVAQLYIDPYTAHHLITGLRKIKKVTPFGVLQLMSNTLEMRPLLRVRAKEHEAIHERFMLYFDALLMMEPSVYDSAYEDFLHSVKTALFFGDWIDEQSEEELMVTFGIRPGEIRAKIANADWLLYAMDELAPLLNLQQHRSDLKKLRLRVQYGVREDVLSLLRLKGVGRIKARRLIKNGLRDLGALKRVDVGTLRGIVGLATARSIKEQLGFKDIKIGKRTGQFNLSRF